MDVVTKVSVNVMMTMKVKTALAESAQKNVQATAFAPLIWHVNVTKASWVLTVQPKHVHVTVPEEVCATMVLAFATENGQAQHVK